MMTDDPADIFNRTRALVGELSAAILGAGTCNIGTERARMDCDLRTMEGNCREMGKFLAQAIEMHKTLAYKIEKEAWELEFKRRAEADVVDMRFL